MRPKVAMDAGCVGAREAGECRAGRLFGRERVAKTLNRPRQNVNPRTQIAMMGSYHGSPLDASQNREAEFEDKLLCQNLNIIYLYAPISVQPAIRAGVVIRKVWAACN